MRRASPQWWSSFLNTEANRSRASQAFEQPHDCLCSASSVSKKDLIHDDPECPRCPPTAARKVEAISAKIQEAAARPLSRAVTFPPAAYTDEDYFAFEAKRVLETGWMCVAHVSQLKEAGSYVAVDLLGEPLVVTRDAANAIHVLARVSAPLDGYHSGGLRGFRVAALPNA